MNPIVRNLIVVGTFLAVTALALLLSLSAPYIKSNDELVYLTGALQAQDGDLPDAYMLQGYEYGPYLHPKVMLAWYEPLGHELFKSLVLIVLMMATGLAAYALFRLLSLPWIPSLILSVILLLPRTAAGTEFFGIFTFHEAIGRSAAVPLFLLGSAFLITRVIQHRSTWPVFGLIGLLLFLHPVTVTLFAFISLAAVGITRLFQRTRFLDAFVEVLCSGVAFLVAGSYFFFEVVAQLSKNVANEGVSSAAYVSAVVFRNAWEFPAASISWFKHIGIVSVFFILLIIFFYTLPKLRELRIRHKFKQEKELLVWGGAVAIGSLFFTLAIPGVNLYLMEHADASYMFQQWSRISKFFYLGLFIMLVPVVYTLWKGFEERTSSLRKIVLAILIAGGVASSSLAFELFQFGIGYPNYTPAYVPQAWSGIPDDATPEEYRETCRALAGLGITSTTSLVSHDFGLRYFCKANLFSTGEEGAAYTYLKRSDLIQWHADYLAQRDALRSGELAPILEFAHKVEASFVVLMREPRYESIETRTDLGVVVTTRHIIVPTGE